jgi:hypothetical protein
MYGSLNDLVALRVHDDNGYDLIIVESSKDAIVARLPIEIEARPCHRDIRVSD